MGEAHARAVQIQDSHHDWIRGMPQFRYKLRTALLATTLFAGAMYYMYLPTQRANAFCRLIRAGDASAAESMISKQVDENDQYRRVVRHVSSLADVEVQEEIQFILDARTTHLSKLTWEQFLAGERSVIIGKGWGPIADPMIKPNNLSFNKSSLRVVSI